MKFELKHINDLTPTDFIKHNIWVQYYSGDEIDFIEEEGYDRKEVESKLEKVNWSDEYWFKSLTTRAVTPYMFTRYYAQFELPNKKIIDGYIEYTEYSGIQNYCLYVDGEFIGLNIHHSDMNQEDEMKLKYKLSLNELYPMIVKCSSNIELNEIFNPNKSR
ncbi:hypothetical protein [Tenacibaculum agarivorans]|uniref:hypothetical protein n=1 Tax=Tenacibaculum agarivorans TaxID=1908389 RepID=UPI00094B9126|nr:hypothetical protein [Tenacibaculum agarivorans]